MEIFILIRIGYQSEMFVYLGRKHVEELQKLEAAILDRHGRSPDDSMQRLLGHQHERHQPVLHITFSLHRLLKLWE